MSETPTDDWPGFVAEKPGHDHGCLHLVHAKIAIMQTPFHDPLLAGTVAKFAETASFASSEHTPPSGERS
jgi:hypothetical protein